jgi:hypothetical protein
MNPQRAAGRDEPIALRARECYRCRSSSSFAKPHFRMTGALLRSFSLRILIKKPPSVKMTGYADEEQLHNLVQRVELLIND